MESVFRRCCSFPKKSKRLDRLLPKATVLQNAAVAAGEEKARNILSDLGLSDVFLQKTEELSGGTVARKVSAKGRLYGYDFTDEQLDWLEANYVKRFKCLLISEALGINDTSLRRAMDSRFASLTFERKKIRNEREQKKKKRSNVTLEKELEKRRKIAELEERMEEMKRQAIKGCFIL